MQLLQDTDVEDALNYINKVLEEGKELNNFLWEIIKYVKDILILEDRFNEQRSIKPKTVVKHFNKGIKWFPFFHIYNYKQWQIDDVHKKLKIFMFDDIYDQYKKLIEEFNFNINGLPKE